MSVETSGGMMSRDERGSSILYVIYTIDGKLIWHIAKNIIIWSKLTKLHIKVIDPAKSRFVKIVMIIDPSTPFYVLSIVDENYFPNSASANYFGIDRLILYLFGK